MAHRSAKKTAVLALMMALGVVAAAGCWSRNAGPIEPIEPFRGVSLRVAVLGEPEMVAMLEDRRGEWERSRGGSVRFEAVAEVGAIGEADLIAFPGDLIGALIDDGRLRTLPESLLAPARSAAEDVEGPAAAPLEDLKVDQIFEVYREEVSRYGGDRVALPLGGTTLVLVYRVAAMQGEGLAAEAEAAGVELAPPTTWEQLDALARFLHDRGHDGDGRPQGGIALALGADEADRLGVEIFLARSAALGLHRDDFSLLFDPDSMGARLEAPPFVEALEALVALRDAGPEGMGEWGAEAAREAFRSGGVALLIDRAEHYASWAEQGDEAELGVARLPGSARMFEAIRGAYDEAEPPNRPGFLPRGGGWLVGVSGSTGRADAAEDLARYLIEPDTAGRLRIDPKVPMLPVRSPLIGQGPALARDVPGLSRRDWSDAVSQTMLSDRAFIGLRIPGTSDYLDDLGRAIASASSGQPSPREALRAAAEAWDARSRELGLERQKWHYRRSLNALATAVEPPPR